VTHLRKRMLEELQRRNYSESTTAPICKQSNSLLYPLETLQTS
jgi:hypothetical protein